MSIPHNKNQPIKSRHIRDTSDGSKHDQMRMARLMPKCGIISILDKQLKMHTVRTYQNLVVCLWERLQINRKIVPSCEQGAIEHGKLGMR